MGNHLSCFVSLQGYKENCGGYTEKKKKEKKKLISEAMTSCAKMQLLIPADQEKKKRQINGLKWIQMPMCDHTPLPKLNTSENKQTSKHTKTGSYLCVKEYDFHLGIPKFAINL